MELRNKGIVSAGPPAAEETDTDQEPEPDIESASEPETILEDINIQK
jgi:hypothetical protein